MNAGSINRMYRLDTGQHRGDQITGQLMDKGTKGGILLGRTPH